MKATRFVWSSVLAVGVFASVPAAVSAAPRVGITVVVNGGGGHDTRDAFRYGFERGRSEGAARGYRYGRGGGDFRGDSWYRGGDRGYRGWMGPRSGYAAGYRQGYEAAYRRACAAARSGGRGYGYDGRGRDSSYGDSGYRDSGYGRGDDRYRDDRRDDGEDWRR